MIFSGHTASGGDMTLLRILNFTSPFELLIAVLLSAQATDVSVNKATAKLYPVANTPAAMLELGVEGRWKRFPAWGVKPLTWC